jgi:hypothetical protein
LSIRLLATTVDSNFVDFKFLPDSHTRQTHKLQQHLLGSTIRKLTTAALLANSTAFALDLKITVHPPANFISTTTAILLSWRSSQRLDCFLASAVAKSG